MPNPARVLLAYPNYLRPQVKPDQSAVETILTPTLSGGSWHASFPLTRLIEDELWQPIRSASAASNHTTFDVDFGMTIPIGMCSPIRHNVTPKGPQDAGYPTHRVKLSVDGTYTDGIYDSGDLAVHQTAQSPLTLPFGWSPSMFTGGPTRGDLAGYASLCSPIFFGGLYWARYLRYSVVDTSNAAGYVQIGGFFAGPAWQPTLNMLDGATIGWVPTKQSSRSPAGIRRVPAGGRTYRVAEFALDDMEPDQAMGLPFDMDARLGNSEPLFVCLDPTSEYQRHRWSFVGYLAALSPVRLASTRAGKTIQIEEKL